MGDRRLAGEEDTMTLAERLLQLPGRVSSIVEGSADLRERLDGALGVIAEGFEAITATLHRLDAQGSCLLMVASRGIPEKIAEVTRRIPVGKGMAGLCAERREPVTVCNLQTDTSGTAKPGARETRVAGGLVVPVFAADGATLLGTLGVGKREEHEYDVAETDILRECAASLAVALARL